LAANELHAVIGTTRGIVAMSGSVVVFIFNDALIKLAMQTMPPLQAIGVRGIFATLWCVLALLATGGWRRGRDLAHPAVAVRGVLEAVAAVTYLVALNYIPIGIATSINLSTPLFLALLAVLILKENVGWRRWTAIAVGFAGVLLVIQPRPGDINIWTWLVVFASLAGAVRDILGRYVPARTPSLVASLSSAATVALLGCGWILFEGWHAVTLRGLGFVVGSSLLLATGYQLLMISLRSGAEISVLGSLRYASVLWALAIGYCVWGDVPNALAVAGIVVIVSSGLYILQRERLRRGK
jgi:drug/metabolite transporter (DMT)-like permease